MVMNAPLPLPGLDELARFSKRAAKAAALLSAVRDEDVDLAATPREEVHRIGGGTLFRLALAGPERGAPPGLFFYPVGRGWAVLGSHQGRSFLRHLAEGGC